MIIKFIDNFLIKILIVFILYSYKSDESKLIIMIISYKSTKKQKNILNLFDDIYTIIYSLLNKVSTIF